MDLIAKKYESTKFINIIKIKIKINIMNHKIT